MKKVSNLLVAVMAVLVMASCAGKKSLDSLNGEWGVVTIGEMAVPESDDVFIGFNTVEQLIYGSTGCNQLTGAMPADVNPETLMFGAMGSTRMLCADMTVEDAMLPALARVVDFNVDGDTLTLLDADGTVLLTLKKR